MRDKVVIEEWFMRYCIMKEVIHNSCVISTCQSSWHRLFAYCLAHSSNLSTMDSVRGIFGKISDLSESVTCSVWFQTPTMFGLPIKVFLFGLCALKIYLKTFQFTDSHSRLHTCVCGDRLAPAESLLLCKLSFPIFLAKSALLKKWHWLKFVHWVHSETHLFQHQSYRSFSGPMSQMTFVVELAILLVCIAAVVGVYGKKEKVLFIFECTIVSNSYIVYSTNCYLS